MRRVLTVFLIAAILAVGSTAAPPASAASRITAHRLPNGLRVLIKDTPGTGLVAVAMLVGAAPRFEDPAQAGISVLVREVALQGTQRRSAEQIAATLETVGGQLSALTGVDHTQWTTLTRTAHVDLALDLLADLLTNATFDPAAVETQRRISLVRLRQQQEQPQSLAVALSHGQLYSLHSYRNPILGTPESLAAISRDQLVEYYRSYYTAPNMVLAIAGDLRTPAALAKAAKAFAGLRTTPVPRRVRLLRVVERALTPRPGAPAEVRERQRTAAAWIAITFLGVKVGDRDWGPLLVLTTILGSGLSSRLFQEIRDRQGLAYSIGAGFATRAASGPITMTAGTDPPNVQKVVTGMLGEIDKLQRTEVSSEELDRGRNRVIGLRSLDHEDLRQQAFYPAWYELLGVGYEFDQRIAGEIGKVTAADVQRVARTYLVNPSIAIVLP